MKIHKTSKIERITKVLEGRKENKFEHNGHAGGLTNKEKARKKNFIMVRKGKTQVKDKLRKSNSDVRYQKMKSVRIINILQCIFFTHFYFLNDRESSLEEKNVNVEEVKIVLNYYKFYII
jgi:hypothetical protein